MSIRLYAAKKYEVKWDGGWFANSPDEFLNVLENIGVMDPCFTDAFITDDVFANDSDIRINVTEKTVSAIRNYAAGLLENPDEVHPCFECQDDCSQMSNKEVADALLDILATYDKFNDEIYLTWF
jgi:hypothetical protein